MAADGVHRRPLRRVVRQLAQYVNIPRRNAGAAGRGCAGRVAGYKGAEMLTSAGAVTAATLGDASIA